MTGGIVAIVGDSPEQVVARALAACQCSEPENHHLYAPRLLAMVMPNEGEPDWPYALVFHDVGSFDEDAEGVHIYGPEAGGVH